MNLGLATGNIGRPGGGILAHPQGPAAGVTSIRQAWAAARAGTPLAEAARGAPELASALAFFDGR